MSSHTGQARRIASEWHGGMSSALYSLSSAGYIDRGGLEAEIDGNLRWCEDHPDTYEGEAGLRELLALREWIDRQQVGYLRSWHLGGHAWDRLWDETPVGR